MKVVDPIESADLLSKMDGSSKAASNCLRLMRSHAHLAFLTSDGADLATALQHGLV